MKLFIGMLGCALFLGFAGGCASRELRDRNAVLERDKDALEARNAELRSSLNDAGSVKDLKSGIEGLGTKLDDLNTRLNKIEDSNNTLASKLNRVSGSSRASSPSKTTSRGSGKSGKYFLRAASTKDKKEAAKLVAFLRKNGVPASSKETNSGKWIAVNAGSFSSIKSSAAKAFASKVRGLSYYGTRPFRGAYFRNK